MKFQYILGLTFILVASCGPERQPRNTADNTGAPVLPAPSAPGAPTAANEGAPAEAENSTAPAAPAPAPAPTPVPAPPATRTQQPNPPSLAEPKGPIDFKSVEAAGQVVQHYGALIEQNRWAEAAKLWGDPGQAGRFAAALKSNRENHLEIGGLGEPEGAAGSIYVSMPITLYGKDADGKAFRSRRTVVLRRVNDVPGSTQAQRHWHIERIDTKPM